MHLAWREARCLGDLALGVVFLSGFSNAVIPLWDQFPRKSGQVPDLPESLEGGRSQGSPYCPKSFVGTGPPLNVLFSRRPSLSNGLQAIESLQAVPPTFSAARF